MAGTNSEVFAASQIVNSVNQQIEGQRAYQMFYDGWPKLSKKKRRKMAYAAVLQSTAKMANALSTCTQANAQFIDTIKKQEELIKLYESKHQTCESRNRERDQLLDSLRQDVKLSQDRCTQVTQLATTSTAGVVMQPTMTSGSCKHCGGGQFSEGPMSVRDLNLPVSASIQRQGLNSQLPAATQQEALNTIFSLPASIQHQGLNSQLPTATQQEALNSIFNLPASIQQETFNHSLPASTIRKERKVSLPLRREDLMGISEASVRDNQQYLETKRELDKYKTQTLQLTKQVDAQQKEYVNMQNQRIGSNREQLKVIEYLQTQLQKANRNNAELKSDVEALHSEKHHMLNYMSQRLNSAQTDANRWKNFQDSCQHTMRTVSEIPQIVNTVQDDIKMLQTQMEIERQRSDNSSLADAANESVLSQSMKPDKRNRSYNNCHCNNCASGNYDECVYSVSNILKDLNTNDNKYTSMTNFDTVTSPPFSPPNAVSFTNNYSPLITGTFANNLLTSNSGMFTKKTVSKYDMSPKDCLTYTNRYIGKNNNGIYGLPDYRTKLPDSFSKTAFSPRRKAYAASSKNEFASKNRYNRGEMSINQPSMSITMSESFPARKRVSYSPKAVSEIRPSKSLNNDYKICTFSNDSYTKVFRDGIARSQTSLPYSINTRRFNRRSDNFTLDSVTRRIND